MISSRFILSISILLFIANYSSAAQCDERGRCKYGGRCNSRNECICPMTCSRKTWTMDSNSLYCAPKNGGRPEIFWNICFVLAKACEMQRDVPLIRFDFTKPNQCEAAFDESWRLCSKPEDFTGPCGGTLEFGQHSSDPGGVCLMDKRTFSKRCECPSGKSGPQCAENNIVYRASTKPKGPEDTSTACDFIGVSIGASIGAGVLLGMLMFALLRKCWCFNSTKKDVAHGSPDEIETSRTENKLHGPTSDKRNHSNCHCVIPIVAQSNRLTPVVSKDFSPSERTPKRQGLSGSSKVTTEDANNNFGSNQPRTVVRGVINGSQSAPQMGVHFSEDGGSTQGLTPYECSRNDAYTI